MRVAPFRQEFHASPSLHAPCNLVPRSLVDEVDKRTGYEITRLAKGGIFRKKPTTVQELIAHLYILFAFTWLLGPIESDVTLNC